MYLKAIMLQWCDINKSNIKCNAQTLCQAPLMCEMNEPLQSDNTFKRTSKNHM